MWGKTPDTVMIWSGNGAFLKITQNETKKYFGGLKIIGAASANCNQGFDILPAPMRGDGRMFVRAKTKTGESGVSCSFDFIDIGKWCRH